MGQVRALGVLGSTCSAQGWVQQSMPGAVSMGTGAEEEGGISGQVQVGVLSAMCHREGVEGVLAGKVGECSGKEGCRVPVCTRVQEFSQQPCAGHGALLPGMLL